MQMYLKDHSKPSYEIDMPFLEIQNNSQNSIPHHFGLSNIVHMLNQKGQKKKWHNADNYKNSK